MGGPDAAMPGARVPVVSLNECITCRLCRGYFADATTIVECLHTFCRSCIVKYLEKNKYCPVCDVQVHKTKPLLNIRPDKTLQDVVYKLVPKLYHAEMQRRREFYTSHPEVTPLGHELQCETTYQHILAPDETICLAMGYRGTDDTPRRYLSCPAAVTVGHLKKLLRAKYDLSGDHKIEVMFNKDCLNDRLSMMDVAYIYSWKRKGPIDLTYQIYECVAKKPKLEPPDTSEGPKADQTDDRQNNWKEVQLRISENGEMSITGIQDNGLLDVVENDSANFQNQVAVSEVKPKPDGPPQPAKTETPKKEMPGLKLITKSPAKSEPKIAETKAPETESCGVSSKIESAQLAVPKQSKTKQSDAKIRKSPSKKQADLVTQLAEVSNRQEFVKNQQAVVKNQPPVAKNQPPVAKNQPPDRKTEAKPVESAAAEEKDRGDSAKAEKGEVRPDDKGDSEKVEAKVDKNNSAGDRKEEEENISKTIEKEVSKPQPSTLSQPISTMIPIKPPPSMTALTTIPPASTTTVFSTTNSKCSTKVIEELPKKDETLTNNNLIEKNLKRKNENAIETDTLAKQPKPTILNHSIGLLNLSNNHPLKKHSKMNRNGDNVSKNTLEAKNEQKSIIVHKNIHIARPGTPATTISKTPNKFPMTSTPCYMPKTTYNPVITVPTPSSVLKVDKAETKAQLKPTLTLNASTSSPTAQNSANNKLTIKTKPATPIAVGYKTLREPPKMWNSQISKAQQAAAVKGANSAKQPTDLKNVRPAKFFKGRNNMPRYLGNPASGVKPMYQVHVSPDKEKPPDGNIPKVEKSEIRKHSIVKIDPKTLKPISEKAPETTSLSNVTSTLGALSGTPPTMGDLKINTSSVSIFNPLKLQSSSPKGDRRSPKSPHSPKVKATATSSAPSTAIPSPTSTSPAKRHQPALTFTPPNPFVPDLSASALGPGPPFLYPGGGARGPAAAASPPGFPPPYDPRVMAAYRNFWYHHRPMRFAGMYFGIGLGEAAAAAAAAATAAASAGTTATQQKADGKERRESAAGTTISQKHSPAASIQSLQQASGSRSTPPPPAKPPLKKVKDQSKPEKSLENAVEKLTQNKVKELGLLSGAKGEPKSEARETKAPEPPPSDGKETRQKETRKNAENENLPTVNADNADTKENSKNHENTSSRTSEEAASQNVADGSKTAADANKPDGGGGKNGTGVGKSSTSLGTDIGKADASVSNSNGDNSKAEVEAEKAGAEVKG